MSHLTFEYMLGECCQELHEQVQIEYSAVDAQDQGQQHDPGFEHCSLLYIQYMQIYKKLEMCYDQTVHPQKRRDIKKILETTIVRILELKEELIHWNRRAENHIVPLDEVLIDLKIPPETVDWQVPRYFTDDLDTADEIEVRVKRIKHWLESFTMPTEPDDLTDKKDPFQVDLTEAEAIRIIQKNERGRTGIGRARTYAEWRRGDKRKEEISKRQAEKGDEDPFEMQVFAATMIAAHWKRLVDRKRFTRMREEEFQFLGMSAPEPPAIENDQVAMLGQIRGKRKKMQIEAEEAFGKACQDAKAYVREKQGPDIIAQRMKKCREWVLEERKNHPNGKFPTELDVDRDENALAREAEEEAGAKPAKAADPKAPKGDEDVEIRKSGTSETVAEVLTLISEYTKMWEGRGERNANPDQQHDVELARQMVRDKVENEIRIEVDIAMAEELANLNKLYDAKKGKEKKGKGKKGGKAKKTKPPKIKRWCHPSVPPACSNVDNILVDMVKDGILKLVTPCKFEDFLGEFAFMGQVQRVIDHYAAAPSAQMIKSLIVEHCVLPLASVDIRQKLSKSMTARSLLLYGPRGTGKTMLARAIATEAGAMFFDLSPNVIQDLYPQPKTGADFLLFKTFTVAQNLAPSVIYIDNVEQVFKAGKKKKGGADPDQPSRIKKLLVAAMKQIKTGVDSTNEDRILFVGNTAKPFEEGVNMRELCENFDFKVWVSFPDCGSRSLMFRKFIESKGVPVDPAKLNLSALAIASDGYSAGSLKMTVNRVLTARRIQQLRQRFLQVQEFLGPLSRTPFSWPEDWLAFRAFDHEASGEKERMEELANRQQAKMDGADAAKKPK